MSREPGDPERPRRLATRLLESSRAGAACAPRSPRTASPSRQVANDPVQFVDVFPRTADRKVHLVPEDLDREAPLGLYATRDGAARGDDSPLALISPATDRTISSTLGQLRTRRGAAGDAPRRRGAARHRGRRGACGSSNECGEVRCPARGRRGIRPGVVVLPKGLWSHNTDNGATASALAPDTLTDLGGGACFNDARVEVERV